MSNIKTAGTAVEPETLMRGMTSTIMEQSEKIREEQREEEQENLKTLQSFRKHSDGFPLTEPFLQTRLPTGNRF